MTRPSHQAVRALELHRAGLNNCEISRATGIPRSTIRERITPRYVRRTGPDQGCFRCLGYEPAGRTYAYLLGLYLGDGCLTASRKQVWHLRIFRDQRYVGLIRECEQAVGAMTPRRVSTKQRIGCVEIGAWWKHWIHLFRSTGPAPNGSGPSCSSLGSARSLMPGPQSCFAGWCTQTAAEV